MLRKRKAIMKRQELFDSIVQMVSCEPKVVAFLRVMDHQIDDQSLVHLCSGAVDALYVRGQLSTSHWKKAAKTLESFNWGWMEEIRNVRPEEFIEEERENYLILSKIYEWAEEDEK